MFCNRAVETRHDSGGITKEAFVRMPLCLNHATQANTVVKYSRRTTSLALPHCHRQNVPGTNPMPGPLHPYEWSLNLLTEF
jgi:hypothetical protein